MKPVYSFRLKGFLATSVVMLGVQVSLSLFQPVWSQPTPSNVPTNLLPRLDEVRQDGTQRPGSILEHMVEPEHTLAKPQPTPDRPEQVDLRDERPTVGEKQDPSLSKHFHIDHIELQGSKLLPADAVNKILAPFRDKDVTFVDLLKAANQLTTLYREEGYVTSKVYIPPQKIEKGVVLMQANEGLIGEINFERGKYFRPQVVKNYLRDDQGDVFDLDTLKLDLRRVNDNPDLKVQATLKAGKNPGETDVDLKLLDQFPFHVVPFYDNLGRKLIGTQRGGVTSSSNNVLGFGDRLLNSVSWSRRSVGVYNHYEMPLGKYGTKLAYDFAHSRLKLGGDFKDLDVTGRATTHSPSVTQELLNTDRFKLSTDLAFDFQDLKTNILGSKFSRDNIRLLRPGINFEEYDKYGRTFMRHEFGIGINWFGATTGNESDVSRAKAGSRFFRYTGSVTRTQRLPYGSFLILRGLAQLSPDRLVSSQQFQMGGAFTVRGYKEGRLIGDNGFLTSGELRVPAYIFPDAWKIPYTQYKLRENIQLVSFCDFGAVYTNRVPAPGSGASDYVMGVGLGVRARLTKYVSGRVDFGFPLLRQFPDNNRARLHFGLQSEIF